MNEILSKISSYNIFNHLFPGAVFVVLAEQMQLLKLPQVDLVTRLLIYYSAGLAISRIGSLVLEPVLKFTGIVRYGDYGDYLRACAKDPKIETLVEQSNTYRTVAAGILSILVAWIIKMLEPNLDLQPTSATAICLIFFLLLFLLSFRKQSDFVRARAEHHRSVMAPSPPPAPAPAPPSP